MSVFRKLSKRLTAKMVYFAISASKLFDKEWYRNQYPEVGSKNPVKHYIKEGWRQGKNPSPAFSTDKYLCAYPDVRAKNMNPLEHYLFHGKRKGRICFSVSQVGIEKEQKTHDTPLVSVVVASYNYAHLLPETLDSILAQTYTHYEIVVVDDGSTDDSLQVIRRYMAQHSCIKLFTHPNQENKGLSATVELGIKESQGDFVAFCESDDMWEPRYLEKKVDVINRYQQVAIISNGVQTFGDEKAVHLRKAYLDMIDTVLNEGGNRVDIYGQKKMNYIPTFSAVMVRKDVLSRLDFNTPVQAWLDFWLYRQILKDELLFYIPEKLTRWRQHQSFNGVTSAASYTHIESDVFIYLSDKLNGIKVSRRVLRNINILRNSSLFDASYYMDRYGSELHGISPVVHYLFVGWKLGYNPSDAFSTHAYLEHYGHLCQTNPLVHYERFSKKKKLEKFAVGSEIHFEVQEKDIVDIKEQRKHAKTVLLISHELSLTGAPRALLNMAVMLQEMGVTPVILSLRHGPMEKEIVDLNIKYFVEPYLFTNYALRHPMLSRFMEAFDVVVFNTLVVTWLIEHLSDIKSRKIAWLHEGSCSYDCMKDSMDFSTLFPLFDHIYAVGEYSKSFAVPYVADKSKLDILLYGIPEVQSAGVDESVDHSKLNFLLPGTISERKGQLILLQALNLLSPQVREQIAVYLAGAPVEEPVDRAIRKCKYPCVKYVGELEHDSLLALFANMDMVLCPSLDDPMPIVCTEAMALGKGVIVSENTGTASFIENGVNGYKVPAGDPEALAKVIEAAVLNRENLPILGKEARKIYEENFTMEIFKQHIKQVILGE